MLGIRPLARFRLRLSLHVCISEYGVVLGNLATCCSRCLFLALWSQRTRLSMTFAFSLWLQYQGQYQLLFIWRFLKMEVPQIINGWPWLSIETYWNPLKPMVPWGSLRNHHCSSRGLRWRTKLPPSQGPGPRRSKSPDGWGRAGEGLTMVREAQKSQTSPVDLQCFVYYCYYCYSYIYNYIYICIYMYVCIYIWIYI